MKEHLLELLRCPLCEGKLKKSYLVEVVEKEIEWGTIECTICENKYPVAFGIPIMMAPHDHVDVKSYRTKDNIVQKGPQVQELIVQIESGQIDSVQLSLLAPRLPRTTFPKQVPSGNKVSDRLSRYLPKFILRIIPWSFLYLLKWFYAQLSFEDKRRHKQEIEILNKLKKETTASGFIKQYFQDTKLFGNSEYYYYYVHRFSQPRYLVSVSLSSILPEVQKPILDLACGVGHVMHYMTATRAQQPCIGLDQNFVQLYIAKNFVAPKGEYLCAKADTTLPFEEDTFSGLMCSDSFYFFLHRLASSLEMQRVISQDGVILLAGIWNSDYPHLPAGINPGYLKNLFKLPNKAIGEKTILETYVKKHGPSLSKEKRIEELNKMRNISLVASNNTDVFQDHKMFDKWPHAVGVLRMNPLYKEHEQDESGNIIYKYFAPSKWYELENSSILKYMPQTITLSPEEKDSILNDSQSGEEDRLIEKFVVLGMPEKYL